MFFIMFFIMRKYYCFCLCLIVLLFFDNNVYSQKDFRPGCIITNNLDTVYGWINFKSNRINSVKCEFKKDEKSEIETYSPYDIKSYLLTNSRFYVSKTINLNGLEKQVFLEYLVDGILDLYYFSEALAEYYFIEKDGELIQLNNNEVEVVDENGIKHIKYTNQYKGVLKKLFGDVTELDGQIINSKFELSSLIKLTKEYHRMVCTNETCIEYRKKKKKDIFCEVFSGADLSFMGLASSHDYAKDVKPVFGLNIRFKDNRYNSKINLIAGLNISNHSFSGEFENTLYTERVKHYNINLKYNQLRIPITLEYNFLPNKFQPIASVSYVNSFLLYPEYAVEIRNYIKDDSYVSVKTESPLRRYEFGFMLGLGFKYQINHNSYLTCVLNAEYRQPAYNLNYILDYLNFKSMLFHIGYGFRIK
jgi:hypothetical protein